MKIVYLAILGACIFLSCSKEEEAPDPSACFMVNKTASTDPSFDFIFNNCSDNYNTSSWDFGDGYSSSEHNPSHRFNQIGQYTVKLTVTNSSGTTSVNTRVITIGHYTLTKIIYNRLLSSVPYPKHAFLSYYNAAMIPVYNNDATISGSSQLPFSVTLSEDEMYDNYSSFYYHFSENDLSSNSYTSPPFTISDLEIVNDRLDKTFYDSGDSAKVTLYFKIVPR